MADRLMEGRVCLVTGATSGIGKATAYALAGLGATVVAHGRNGQKCKKTVEEIRKATGNPSVESILADFSVLDDVRRMAAKFKESHDRLHVLVNNAGAILWDCRTTKEGVETTFAVNHLSHFLLTDLLLDTVKASPPARIINVSSGLHWGASRDFERLGCEGGYSGMGAYGRSKLANVLFTYELARRLKGSGVTANCLHPGFVATNIGRDGTIIGALRPLMNIGAISPEEGAKTTVYLASSPQAEKTTGKYFERMREAESSPDSRDHALAKRLWEISSKLAGT
jgi:NAD(P)-dependent dehydrogenase (short-subunit alcohol dehydrogenase family)